MDILRNCVPTPAIDMYLARGLAAGVDQRATRRQPRQNAAPKIHGVESLRSQFASAYAAVCAGRWCNGPRPECRPAVAQAQSVRRAKPGTAKPGTATSSGRGRNLLCRNCGCPRLLAARRKLWLSPASPRLRAALTSSEAWDRSLGQPLVPEAWDRRSLGQPLLPDADETCYVEIVAVPGFSPLVPDADPEAWDSH